MPKKIPKSEKRTIEQLREHYKLEKELAIRLRASDRKERRYLYGELYDELFRTISHHPMLILKKEPIKQLIKVSGRMSLLRKFLKPEFIFLEIGPGDLSLSLEVSKTIKKVYAVDVSKKITKDIIIPKNLKLIISDGISISVPKNCVDFAYSNDLMEHLHPEDAFDQLKNIYMALTNGGKYLCITPNRLSGPHDISKYFDNIATGFHLKEYTVTELSKLFYKVGFSKINTYIGGKGIYLKFPLLLIKICEKFLNILTFSFRKKIANTLPFKALLGIIILGTKSRARK